MHRPRLTAGAPSLLALVSLPLASAMDPDGLVDQARKGLAAFIASYPDVPAVSPDDILLAECPLMTPDELVAAVAPVGDASALEDVITGSIQVDRLTQPQSLVGGGASLGARRRLRHRGPRGRERGRAHVDVASSPATTISTEDFGHI